MPLKTALPELSIIVPTLNEAETLPALFATLARQRQVAFELILVDGGSTDGTMERAASLASESPFCCRLLHSERGRARQLNTGARAARAEILLFLHADSLFPYFLALRKGVDALAASGGERAAGHFALRFDLAPERYRFGYYYLECKARLDRPGCMYGDQGFLLRRAFFTDIGPFDESLPFLEDIRLAEAVRQKGRWLLLPAAILTSARRYESEGYCQRQLLNALIMNFAAIGWDDFFQAAPGIYRRQDRARRLQLLPFFRAIRGQLRTLSWRRRLALWYRSGCFVRRHAWLVAFALDSRRNFRRGLPVDAGTLPLLTWTDRWFDRLTDHPPGRLAAAVLVWLWFHGIFLLRFLREEKATSPTVCGNQPDGCDGEAR